MGVVAAVSKDQIRRHQRLYLLEYRLDLGALVRHEAIGELLEQRILQLTWEGEQLGSPARFFFSDARGTEHHPVNLAVRIARREAQKSAPATDLNIVGMRSQAQNLQRTRRRAVAG